MQKINLYKYNEADGSIMITPNKRNETDNVYKYRLIADEKKILTDGEIIAKVIDVPVENVEFWNEIDDIYTEIEEQMNELYVEEEVAESEV